MSDFSVATNSKSATVIFDMWGQRCSTEFDAESELTPMEWICRCFEHGWLLPVEICIGTVVISKEEIMTVVNAYEDGQKVGRIWKSFDNG